MTTNNTTMLRFRWVNGDLSYRPVGHSTPTIAVTSELRKILAARFGKTCTVVEGVFDGNGNILVEDAR